MLVDTFKRMRRNSAYALGAAGIALVAGVVQIGLNARGLGPAALGVLVLVQTFAMMLERLFAFDTWQPLLRLADARDEPQARREARDLVVLAGVYDLGAALISAVAGALLVLCAKPLIGLSEADTAYGLIFAATLAFRIPGAPLGVLRLFDRFDLIAGWTVGEALVRLGAAAALFAIAAPLAAYVWTFAGLTVATNLALVLVAWAVYVGNRLPPLLEAKWSEVRRHAGDFALISWTNFGTTAINAVRTRADVFMLGALLGPAAVGLYAVALRMSAVGGRVADPLQQIAFPEISVLGREGRWPEFRRLLIRLAVIGGLGAAAFVLAVAVLGPLAIELIAGPRFREAMAPLVWLGVAMAIYLAGFWVRPAALATVGPKAHLMSYVAAALAMAIALPFAITAFGVAGAGLSQLVFNSVWFLVNVLGVWRYLVAAPVGAKG